jgi:hypothetical protein
MDLSLQVSLHTKAKLVRDAEVNDDVDRPHSVGEIRSQLEVSTPLTPT